MAWGIHPGIQNTNHGNSVVGHAEVNHVPLDALLPNRVGPINSKSRSAAGLRRKSAMRGQHLLLERRSVESTWLAAVFSLN